MSIVVTIHQPSFKILQLFHQLYVLSKGGKCIFFGAPQELPKYLKHYGIFYSEGHNPGDILMDVAAEDILDEVDANEDVEVAVMATNSKVQSSLQIEASEMDYLQPLNNN